jgi:hypothetical protein
LNPSQAIRSATPRNDRAVLCPHCEHLNTWDVEECVLCHRELFMECEACGARNERVRSRCNTCRKPLFKKGGKLLSSEIRMAENIQRRRALVASAVGLTLILILAVLRLFKAI